MLNDNKIHRVTNELYDTQVYEGRSEGNKIPWIIIFLKDRFNSANDGNNDELNRRVFESMWQIKLKK